MTPVIAFVGPDGAGKSTQIELLQQSLEARGIAVRTVHQHQPGTAAEARVLRLGTAWVRPVRGPRSRSVLLAKVLGLAYAIMAIGKAWVRWGRRSRDATLLLDRTIVDEHVRLEFRLGVRSQLLAASSRWRLFAPDITIGLALDPDVGRLRKKTAHLSADEYRRKAELTLAAIDAVEQAYNVHWIAVDGLSASAVHACILNVLTEADIVQ